ncbi:MAG: hypothetical protein WBL95_18385 [Microcoleus sp.]
MFGFIKNFFGGIFGFFARLLGLKKSEYFLDLGNSDVKDSPKVELAAAKKPEPVVAAPAAAKADAPKSESPTKAKTETAKKSKKEQEPVKVAAATKGKASSSSEPTLTFAPNNLMPTPNASRRTPGPSMNSFREMARQVKTK